MKNNIYLIIIIVLPVAIFLSGCAGPVKNNGDVVIENEEMRLIIGGDGAAISLLHKQTNRECLLKDKEIPLFSIMQYYISNNETRFTYPFKKTEFIADTVYRKGNKLIVGFITDKFSDKPDIEAIINLKITPQYIHFSIEDFVFSEMKTEDNPMAHDNVLKEPEIDEMCFLQLPVANMVNFGEWLNVMWDDQVSVNILGTDPYARIDFEERNGFRILRAGMVSEVMAKGVGAALITTSTDKLPDYIARVEEDFGLPKGVQSRRHKNYILSCYWTDNVNKKNVDKHIEYAQKAGFRAFQINYMSFSVSPGHFEWNGEYPNGIEDLIAVTEKIKGAGMIPGFHLHYNKAGKSDKYVTPVPDHRLNLRKYFTLAAPLSESDTTVYTEENPDGTTLGDGRRILMIGEELISYSDYSTNRPYKFTGCERGSLNTTSGSYAQGTRFGLLDVDTWPAYIRFDQKTSIQEEVSKRLAEIYNKAGGKFLYFDGPEDVPPPYWFNCSKAQLDLYKRLNPEPVFTEGPAKSHFSWHMLSRANAFDLYPPEILKNSIKKYPAAAAEYMKKNFSGINFGWLGYWDPGEHTTGTQPDMLEYASSRAAAWDCPVSMQSSLEKFEKHPRTSDNLEVLRRWEEVRISRELTEEQKVMLRDLEQEHILLINEKEEYELVPYEQITNVAGSGEEIRAFIFERQNELYVTYWHISANKKLELQLGPGEITLLEKLGEEVPVKKGQNNTVILPADNRRYLKTNTLSESQLITAFQNATVIN